MVAELAGKGAAGGQPKVVGDEADSAGVLSDAAWEWGGRPAKKTAGLERDARRRRFWSAGGRKGHNPEILRQIAQELFD